MGHSNEYSVSQPRTGRGDLAVRSSTAAIRPLLPAEDKSEHGRAVDVQPAGHDFYSTKREDLLLREVPNERTVTSHVSVFLAARQQPASDSAAENYQSDPSSGIDCRQLEHLFSRVPEV